MPQAKGSVAERGVHHVARGQDQQRPDPLAAFQETVTDRLAEPAGTRREAAVERPLDEPAVVLDRARDRGVSHRRT